MNNYNWKILDITAKDEQITHAKYFVEATTENKEFKVATEGNWTFNGKIKKEYLKIKEEDVIELLQKETVVDGVNIIESRLDEQLAYLENQKIKSIAPWLPQTFTMSDQG